MNLYFRFFWTVIKALFAKPMQPFAESRIKFRVLPTDIDINFHVTNSRYLSFMDLGRTYLLGQVKLFPYILKQKWLPVLTGCEITFIRALNPFQRFTLVSRILTCDEKYFYFEQRFEIDGEIYAVALLRGLFMAHGKKISMTEVLQAINFQGELPALPEVIVQWKKMNEVKVK